MTVFLNSFLFAETPLERLSRWNVLTGLILAVLGLLIMVFSSFFVNKVFKDKPAETKTAYILRLKTLSAVLAFAGLILAVII